MKMLLRLIHYIAIGCAVLMMGFAVWDRLQLNGFKILELNALAKIILFLIGLAFAGLVLWKGSNYARTNLRTLIVLDVVWTLLFLVFFVHQYRIVPELHGFGAVDYRREYLKGLTMLIVATLFWIGTFSIGPILKWRNSNKNAGIK